MSRLQRCAVVVALASLLACASQPHPASVHASAPACAPGDGAPVAQAIREMYAAFAVDDAAVLGRLFASDFYAFDAGQRFTGPEMVSWIKAAHAAGKTFVWNVALPEVHLVCDVAWVTWENRGSIADTLSVQPVTWIESAVLRWGERGWRIVFFHSSRTKPASPPAPAQGRPPS